MRLGLAFSLATILVFSIVSAIPIAQRRQTGNEGKFRLKTGGSSNIEHNNLYVESYHTGAGASDAVLAGLNTSAIFFLNGTNAQYDAGTPFPWGINLEGNTNYAGEWIVSCGAHWFELGSVTLSQSGNSSHSILDMAQEIFLSIVLVFSGPVMNLEGGWVSLAIIYSIFPFLAFVISLHAKNRVFSAANR